MLQQNLLSKDNTTHTPLLPKLFSSLNATHITLQDLSRFHLSTPHFYPVSSFPISTVIFNIATLFHLWSLCPKGLLSTSFSTLLQDSDQHGLTQTPDRLSCSTSVLSEHVLPPSSIPLYSADNYDNWFSWPAGTVSNFSVFLTTWHSVWHTVDSQ